MLLELVHREWAAMLMACIGNHRYEQVGWELVGVLSEIAWCSRCSRFGYGLEVFSFVFWSAKLSIVNKRSTVHGAQNMKDCQRVHCA